MLHIQVDLNHGRYPGTPRSYWTIDTGIEATKWLIEEKLCFNSSKDILDNINTNIFRENGLGGCLRTCFNDSPIDAIIYAYPDKFTRKGNILIERINKRKSMKDI